MHAPILAGGRLGQRRPRTFFARRRCSLRRVSVPRRVERRAARGKRTYQRRERRRRVREQFDFAAPVLAQFFGVVTDAQEARLRPHGRRAVAGLVVELAADDDREIGFLHRARTHRADRRRMRRPAPGRDFPACRGTPRRWHRGIAPSSAPASCAPRPVSTSGRRACAISAAARSTSAGSGGIRRGVRARQVLRHHDTRRHGLSQHIGRNLDVHRTGGVAVAERRRGGLVQVAQQTAGDAQVRALRVTGRMMDT